MNRDITLYGLIGLLTALLAAPDPISWRTAVGVVLAGLIAVKAKLSPGKDQSEESEK